MLAALGLVALIAFSVEGAIGFGGTVIAVSLGAQLAPLELLLPAFVPLNLAMSAWLLGTGVRAISWRVLLLEIVPMVAIGAAGGLALAHVGSGRALVIAFGCFVVVLAGLSLLRPPARPLAGPIRGGLLALGGIAHGLFGTGGPMIVYVARRRIADKRAFRATLAVLWLALNTLLLVNFIVLGRYGRATLDTGLVLALAIVPGLWLGERVHRALEPARFERLVWSVLLVAGAALALRSALSA